MSVYIDSMNASYGRMRMCHMVADSHEELVTMADMIGVARKWIQYPNTHREHFDICMSKKAKALELGAIEVSTLTLGRFLRDRRASTVAAPVPEKGGE